jgi:hypothetical protein
LVLCIPAVLGRHGDPPAAEVVREPDELQAGWTRAEKSGGHHDERPRKRHPLRSLQRQPSNHCFKRTRPKGRVLAPGKYLLSRHLTTLPNLHPAFPPSH